MQEALDDFARRGSALVIAATVMYSTAPKQGMLVEDPPYNKDVCGFQGEGGHFGCVPLNGCGSQASFAYFISFNLIIAFVFLNLFIGVILDGFEQAKSGNLGNLNTTDFEQFQDHWARFDTEAKGFIKTTDLKEFLRTLFEPWGFGGAAVDNVQLKLRIAALRLTIRHKDIDGAHHVSCVAFLEVLTSSWTMAKLMTVR